jgi:hypothetical protein
MTTVRKWLLFALFVAGFLCSPGWLQFWFVFAFLVKLAVKSKRKVTLW